MNWTINLETLNVQLQFEPRDLWVGLSGTIGAMHRYMTAVVSNCCKAPVRVEGRTTQHYVCSKCERPCDPYEQNQKLAEAVSNYIKSIPKQVKHIHSKPIMRDGVCVATVISYECSGATIEKEFNVK